MCTTFYHITVPYLAGVPLIFCMSPLISNVFTHITYMFGILSCITESLMNTNILPQVTINRYIVARHKTTYYFLCTSLSIFVISLYHHLYLI